MVNGRRTLIRNTLQIERELMIRLYGRESFCDYRKTTSNELATHGTDGAQLHITQKGRTITSLA